MKYKILNLSAKMNFETFVKCMNKGYSGGGNDKEFTFTSFNGTACEPFSIPQTLMLAYQNYMGAKAMLSEQLKTWK